MISTQTAELLAVLQLQQCGNFTRAAEALGLTASALSKTIDRLEKRLGTRLFERSTRRVVTTADGERFIVHARRIVEDLAEAEADLRAGRNVPRGTLRITVGTAFGNQLLLPVLPDFMAQYPEVRLALSVTDHLVDVAEAGFDLALRLGPLGSVDRLVARQITALPRKVCAAPSYLRRHGTPAHPAELTRHQCLTVADSESADQWPFMIDRQRCLIDVGARLSVDSAESLLSLALAGGGIVRQSAFLLQPALDDGRLSEILLPWRADDTLPLTALYPPGRQHQAKLTAMLDFLSARFGTETTRCTDRRTPSS
ncbi:LysR family transcriptional regulator [Paludibacterium purpuratum]|uniref:LysR family transcriptional regulator n=1 Tax=Paludibacterium purpuratum TaxID=1144873 RepID=A0A4R7B3D5_9NEIS|nr:LysR family transcriptional regulator [Paludibacterium purpuratum]TDR76485.1 LysR family transcriptional regulator [Paludibacterium purpuratum]